MVGNIGNNLKEIRLLRGLTQEDLASKVQVSQAMIAQMERGSKSISIPLGKEIAGALNCSLEDLAKWKKLI